VGEIPPIGYKMEKVFEFCIEYTKDTEDRLRRKDQIYLKKVILEEYKKFIDSGLASVVLEMGKEKLYQIDPMKILAIVKSVDFEETKKSLVCKLEAKYIDNIYFESFEEFKKNLDTVEFRVASAIILNKSKEIENVKILAFYLGVKDE
jgi:hypothetical protein